MTYARVIPRDLFNEGNLLTCLGRLVILLGETPGHTAKVEGPAARDRFDVYQNSGDGSISCVNVTLTIGDRENIELFRPLNARDKWPLYALRGADDEVRVFDLDGALDPDFRRMIGL